MDHEQNPILDIELKPKMDIELKPTRDIQPCKAKKSVTRIKFDCLIVQGDEEDDDDDDDNDAINNIRINIWYLDSRFCSFSPVVSSMMRPSWNTMLNHHLFYTRTPPDWSPRGEKKTRSPPSPRRVPGPRLRRGPGPPGPPGPGPDRGRTGPGPDRDRRTAGTGPGGTQQPPPPPKAAGEPILNIIRWHSVKNYSLLTKTNPGAPNNTEQ